MSRNAVEWKQRPEFPETHFVSTDIYTDEQIFREEQQKIFNACWIIACHESELPGAYDYRTFNHPGGSPLIVIRGDDGTVRSFYNICPHRGNTLLYDPVGNAKRITCIFHAWSFNAKGDCIDISRGKQGYQDRFGCEHAGLREVKTEIGYGGFVWVNVDDDSCSLADYIGEAMGMLAEPLLPPLEVFHYHKAVVDTNYKLWHDTNSEFYHDYMHYFNRITGMMQPGYFDRKYTGFPNGHASVGSMSIKYDAYEGGKQRGVGWPGLTPGGWILIDVFPGMTYNLRTSVLRIDTAIPLGPNKLLIEFRGLGLKSDTPEQRAERIRDHNQIWGPFGRNLHEDLLGVHGQGLAMKERTDSKWVLHGREENMTIHDEGGMRHFYAEWSRRMGRKAHDPHAAVEAAAGLPRAPEPPRRSSAPPEGPRPPLRLPPTHRPTASSAVDSRHLVCELVYRSCMALDEKNFNAFLGLCDPGFQYAITAYSPEIRKEMTWLEHDKAGMQLLFNNLPRHNSDHSPLSRHVTVYTVSGGNGNGDDASQPAQVVSALQVFKTSLDGGATELFAVGKLHDTITLAGGEPRLLRRNVRLDTRMLGYGYHIPF